MPMMPSFRIAAVLGWLMFALPAIVGAQGTPPPSQGVDDVTVVPPDTDFPAVPAPPPRLSQHCVVSVLNHTARVAENGTFVIDNVPVAAGGQKARVSASCDEHGTTLLGQSDLFDLNAADVAVPPIHFDALVPIPASLEIGASTTTLASIGATTALTVTAHYTDGGTADVTTAAGTSYRSSNPAVATVGATSVVTAVGGGPVLVSVLHEGVSGFLRLEVDVPSVDSDGDGIPDAVETANGFDPNDPNDGFADADGDGLSNEEELVVASTDPRTSDTDGDGLSDGQEVLTYETNPLAADTDGDGVRDALEIATGSDPLDAASLNLAQALDHLAVAPGQFVLPVSTILGSTASIALAVTGHLIDGSTINLTPTSKGTSYQSSDLTVCGFAPPAGTVTAGSDGACAITVANAGHSVQVLGFVLTVTPQSTGFLTIPGFANNVDVSGDFAYVAAGSAGLEAVNVADRAAPTLAGTLDTPGNANDVVVVGTTAYVADGSSGLRLIDVTNPLAPTPIGAADTPGLAQDVVVKGALAYVADGDSGLAVVDVSNAAAPVLRGEVDTPGTVKGVAVVADAALAVVADGTAGVEVVNVANPLLPAIVGSLAVGGDARDVAVEGHVAYVADYDGSLVIVDLADPQHPALLSRTGTLDGGILTDVALDGRFALGADVVFVNGVPIVDVTSPAAPSALGILDFSSIRADNGTGIALDRGYVYETAEPGTGTENGTSGDTRLYVGRYRAPTDSAGVPPTATITAPAPGTTVIAGDTLPITVTAADDVGVAAVDFFANGTRVHTATAAPYAFTLTVPTGAATLTLGATAIDFGNVVGTASDVAVTVVPDPGTTVTGRVVDEASAPLVGATVTCLGVSATSAADGTFLLANLSTIAGDVQCTAAVTNGAHTLHGTSAAVPPVRGGTTPVGDVVVPRIAFRPAQSYAAGGANPIDIAVGDFDGDSHLDVVTASSNVAVLGVSVVYGVGDGSFHDPRGVGVGSIPASVAVVDLDGDGKQDIVTGDAGVSVLLGHGDGTFAPVRHFAADGGPARVGYVDGDGHLDVVSASSASHEVAVLLGNGDGTLQAAQRFAATNFENALALADFDGNNTLDVVVVGQMQSGANDLAVLLGDGHGAFGSPQHFIPGTLPMSVAVADFNEDHNQDVATANFNDVALSVLLGNGNGTLQPQQLAPVGNGPFSVVAADLDGDGHIDLAASRGGSNDIVVLLGNGDGTFGPVHHFTASNGTLRNIAVADLDGDGRLDIVAADFNSAQISVLLQKP